jgi:hypothetical protein
MRGIGFLAVVSIPAVVLWIILDHMAEPSPKKYDSPISAVASYGGNDINSPVASKSLPTHFIHQPFSVGYWGYVVNSAQWHPFVYDLDRIKQPDSGTYLFVDVSVRNNDRTESVRPQFKLVDTRGREFSEYSVWQNGWLSNMQSLNPGVAKRGMIFFDAPRGIYNLQVSGGFESSEIAVVDLTAVQ